jgi:hypothetical protein
MLVSWLLGGVVVLGLLYLLDLSWRMERPAVDEPPAPAARSVAPPEPIMVPPPMVRDRAVPKASPKVDADESRRKAQLAALQKRRETCEYWTRENTRGQYNGLQTTACNDWRNLAAQLGVSTSPVPARRGSAGGGASVMPQAAPQPRTTAVLVNHCSQFTDGSIQYRQCRWTEKKRLESACSRYEWEANNRRGSQGDIARAKAWA